MAMANFDMVGITDSWWFAYHVQSYFLYFKKNIIESGFLKQFFDEVQVLSNKGDIINRYEIGLSKKLACEGFSVGALTEYRKIYQEFHTLDSSINQDYIRDATVYFWKELLINRHSPFIKKSNWKYLDVTECLYSPLLENILRESGSKFSFELIERHLKRMV
jgi:lipopolysaccharide biosynthesis protein